MMSEQFNIQHNKTLNLLINNKWVSIMVENIIDELQKYKGWNALFVYSNQSKSNEKWVLLTDESIISECKKLTWHEKYHLNSRLCKVSNMSCIILRQY